MRLLIVHGAGTGATDDVAELLAVAFADRGLDSEIEPAELAPEPAGYDAIVVEGFDMDEPAPSRSRLRRGLRGRRGLWRHQRHVVAWADDIADVLTAAENARAGADQHAARIHPSRLHPSRIHPAAAD